MKKWIMIVLFFNSIACFASPLKDTLPVPLPGGSVAPGKSLKIYTKPLNQAGMYQVSCDIYNSKYNKQFPVIIGLGGGVYLNKLQIFLNGRDVAPTDGQAKLNHYDNKYLAIQVPPYQDEDSYLYFYNYDSTDTVEVENCWAILMSAAKKSKTNITESLR